MLPKPLQTQALTPGSGRGMATFGLGPDFVAFTPVGSTTCPAQGPRGQVSPEVLLQSWFPLTFGRVTLVSPSPLQRVLAHLLSKQELVQGGA